MQCHLGDSEAAESLVRPGRSARDFRPGGRIADFLFVVTVDPPGSNRFGLGSQADRLLMSRCYKESGGAIDCLTCHNPHVSVYDKEAPADRFRKACLTCHAEFDCRADRASRAGIGDDCTKCHMRRAEPSDQRYTAFTDHWIRKRIDPPDAGDPERSSVALADLLVDGKTSAAEATINRAVAYYGKRSRGHFVTLIPAGEPERLFREALSADPSSAEAWYYLGRLAEKEGRVNEAMGDYREALRISPDHRNARQFLATALFGQNRAAEAEPLLVTAIESDPADLAAITELSRLLVTVGKEADAAALLDRGLAIDPDHPTLLANRGLLSAKRGRHVEAAEDLRRSAALDPSMAEVWEALAGSLAAAGRGQEAQGPARRAADLRSTLRR
jgi:predicted CXXCH cytochrome family protein